MHIRTQPQTEGAVTFAPGSLIRVKDEPEIVATLGVDGMLDGLPFMAEMRKWCGRICRVQRPVNRIFIETGVTRGMADAYLLSDVRCSGESHGGCRRACQLFWKSAWLVPVKGESPEYIPDNTADCTQATITTPPVTPCQGQAGTLMPATYPLPVWRVGQYLHDVRSGATTLPEEIRMLGVQVTSRCAWGWLKITQHLRPPTAPQLPAPLHLQPGEWVQVLSAHEIERTLDRHRKTRGMMFTELMRPFCGKRYRVLQRVDRMIIEASGTMQTVVDTVILEGVTCRGTEFRGCPRNCFWLWKEAWLQRVAADNMPLA